MLFDLINIKVLEFQNIGALGKDWYDLLVAYLWDPFFPVYKKLLRFSYKGKLIILKK